MWIQEFENLNRLKRFIVENLALSNTNEFSFCKAQVGMELDEIEPLLGSPTFSQLENKDQQTLQYNAQIKHETLVNDKLNMVTLLFLAYHYEPLEIIKLHIKHASVGVFAEEHRNFVVELINEIQDKFGKPIKKTLRIGRSEIRYEIDGSELFLWQSHDGVRVQLKNKK